MKEPGLLRTLVERRELLHNLVARELKSRYKGSALGFLWSILTPLFMAIIYAFFIRLLAGRNVSVEEILIGVFAWQFTAQCVNGGLNCITGNSDLVKKVYFPRCILPVSVVLANLINFLLSLVVQIGLVIVLLHAKGQVIGLGTFALPAVIAYHTLFNLSVIFLLSSFNVYYRDTQHLVGVLITAWFFLSPAMYNLTFVENLAGNYPALADVYMLNPMAPVITAYRALMLNQPFPFTIYSAVGLVWPVVLLFVAYTVFQRWQRDFSDML